MCVWESWCSSQYVYFKTFRTKMTFGWQPSRVTPDSTLQQHPNTIIWRYLSLSLSLSLCNVCHWQALSSPGSGGAVPAQHRWRGEITHLLVPSPPTRGNYQMWQLQLWKITSQRRNVASLPPIYILPLLPLSSWVRWEEECPTNIITLTLAISISAPPQSSPVNYLIIVPDPISKCIFIILSAS